MIEDCDGKGAPPPDEDDILNEGKGVFVHHGGCGSGSVWPWRRTLGRIGANGEGGGLRRVGLAVAGRGGAA